MPVEVIGQAEINLALIETGLDVELSKKADLENGLAG